MVSTFLWELWGAALFLFCDGSWRVFALLAVVIACHEGAHALVGRPVPFRRRWRWPIPLLGPSFGPRRSQRSLDRVDLAGLAGPVAGLAVANLFALFGHFHHHPSFAYAGALGITINLASTLPFRGFDGECLVRPSHQFRLALIGAAVGIGLVFLPISAIRYLVGIAVVVSAGTVLWKEPADEEEPVALSGYGIGTSWAIAILLVVWCAELIELHVLHWTLFPALEISGWR